MDKKNTKLLKENEIKVSKTRTIIISLYSVIDTKKRIEYKKISLKNKDEKFIFYERLCFKNIFNKEEQPIGIAVFSVHELVIAINSIANELYKPFNLDLKDFIRIIEDIN